MIVSHICELFPLKLHVTQPSKWPHARPASFWCGTRSKMAVRDIGVLGQFSQTLSDLLISQSSQFTLFIGDFNVNWFNSLKRRSLYNLFTRDHKYRQLETCCTTNNKTLIDLIFTNIQHKKVTHTRNKFYRSRISLCPYWKFYCNITMAEEYLRPTFSWLIT